MSELENKEAYNVGVVGATGLVGQEMLSILEERRFPVDELSLFASPKSAGKEIEFDGQKHTVEVTQESKLQDQDIVLFSAGKDISLSKAPIVADAGGIAIDNSSAWRRRTDVPLVVSEVNPEDLRKNMGIIANPNCTTMIGMPTLNALHKQYGLTAMTVFSAQAVSGSGQKGINELDDQVSRLTDPYTNREELPHGVYPQQALFNFVAFRGEEEGRSTDEEHKLLNESRKILNLAKLAVSATCNTVPVYRGHQLEIDAEFAHEIHPEDAEVIINEAKGVELVNLPSPIVAVKDYPNTTIAGRLRQSGVHGEYGLQMVIAGDNLRKGAALNAVQIAEKLVEQAKEPKE